MNRKIVWTLFVFLLVLFYSCGSTGEQKRLIETAVNNKIHQNSDGTISLKIDKADCYQDSGNPSTNTAEWNVVVSKSGRFNVWLSSATRDTTYLNYNSSVMFSILDNRIEAHPECDKIVRNSGDVNYPYFRADSFIGSLYIQDTGIFNVQVISDKIITKDIKNEECQIAGGTKLLSVFLTPVVH